MPNRRELDEAGSADHGHPTKSDGSAPQNGPPRDQTPRDRRDRPTARSEQPPAPRQQMDHEERNERETSPRVKRQECPAADDDDRAAGDPEQPTGECDDRHERDDEPEGESRPVPSRGGTRHAPLEL